MKPIVLNEKNWYVRAFAKVHRHDVDFVLRWFSMMNLDSCALRWRMFWFVVKVLSVSVAILALAGFVLIGVFVALRDLFLFFFSTGGFTQPMLMFSTLAVVLSPIPIAIYWHKIVLFLPAVRSGKPKSKFVQHLDENLDVLAHLWNGWKKKYCQPVVIKDKDGNEIKSTYNWFD